MSTSSNEGLSNEPLSNSDMALCVSYVDGALEPGAQRAFEQRLASEPKLAAATQALLETDEMLRKLTAGEQRKLAQVRRLRPWIWVASIAAAAAILIVFARGLLEQRGQPRFEVALAPSFESPLDYIASQPAIATLRPPGLDVLRGDNSQPNIDAAEFVARASAVEPHPASTGGVTAGYFVVPIRLASESTVLVVAFPSGKNAGARPAAGTRLWPAADAQPGAQFGRLAPGEHVLPQPRFTLELQADGTSNVSYHRGFLVPVGCGELTVICAVRRAPLNEIDWTAFDGLMARGDVGVGAWLDGHGFARTTLVVTEPAH